MFKINMVLSNMRDAVSNIMSDVEDSVENYQLLLVALHVVRLWCSSPMKSIFSFCHSYFDICYDFHAHMCFHSHFFSAHTSLGCRKCLMGMFLNHMLSRTPYRTCVAACHFKSMRRRCQIIEREILAPRKRRDEA